MNHNESDFEYFHTYISFLNRPIYSLGFKTSYSEVGQPTASENIIQQSFHVDRLKAEISANPQF